MTATCAQDDNVPDTAASVRKKNHAAALDIERKAYRLETLLAARTAAERDVLWIADYATDTFFEPAATPCTESIMIRLRAAVVRAKTARRAYEAALDAL